MTAVQRSGLALLLAVLAAAAVACGSADSPPTIAYGRDVCAECHMIISEARFAAAYRTTDGTEYKFDDIGDMLVHGERTHQLEDATVWVHDFETEEWLDAHAAFYGVGTAGADTPMGRGIVAFGDRVRADSYASSHSARVVTWDELLAIPLRDSASSATTIQPPVDGTGAHQGHS